MTDVAKAGPERHNTAGAVITFFPDVELNDRLRGLTQVISTWIIVDNSGSELIERQLRGVTDQAGVELMLNATNVGVGRALNQAAKWAAAQGFAWLLTLDQDSKPLPNILESLIEAWRSCRARNAIGVIGSKSEAEIALADNDNNNPVSVITSGSLINLAAWKAVGGFRDDFFIDAVDEEFCLRLQRNGYKVIQATQPGIDHVVGRPSQHRLFGRTIHTSNHPPSRRYYMARNRIRLAAEYFRDEPRWIMRYFWYTTKDSARMLLFEQDRRKKLYAIALGIRDGLLERMGPLRNKALTAKN